MKDLGWKWSQATVWSIEKGERPLRVAEAQDLIEILNIPSIDSLTGRSWERSLSELQRRVESTRESAFHAIQAYNNARLNLAFALDDDLVDKGVSGTAHEDFVPIVGMGPIELAEAYERWAVNHAQGDAPKDRDTSNAVFTPGDTDPFTSLFFKTSGYRGDMGQNADWRR